MYNQDTPFNMAIKTLERIHDLLIDCAGYCVNNNVIAYKRNLKEIWKEANGHLTKPERTIATNKWGVIDKIEIKVYDEAVIFDSKLWGLLDDFDFWIRKKLHEHNLTFSQKELNKGLEAQRHKYGLE